MHWLFALVVLLPAQDVSFTEGKKHLPGYFDLYWDETAGELYLAIDRFEDPFLWVNGLATGLGSNDIGLDRGQLGENRVVHFSRTGNSVYLIEPNMLFRADSDNALEKRAVSESFASATHWGTKIAAEEKGRVFVNLRDLVMRDSHLVTERLSEMKEGNYRLEASRSHYYLPRTKSFPENTEVEVSLTYTGTATGRFIEGVVADSGAITLRLHYSFVKLPPPGFEMRAFHPRSGGWPFTYRDYAAPLDASLDKKFLRRHRLVRKNPNAKKSELVEPLVYYVDAGAPPQIQQALIEGASWWNEAFEAAGILNGFQVKILPGDVDPMDVRYNVIQWVHRATRGWSYGGSVVDPRTGEIIKGHVTLGSLRVRQDRLLFEGMLANDTKKKGSTDPVELSLARIRQLSAHEVGHTLGIAHNFAASTYDRGSVMDYPAPLVTLQNGTLDFSKAYDVGIGEWDKITVRYLYGHWQDERKGLEDVLADAEKNNMLFITDQDSRMPGSMHPLSNLWDNGSDPLDELERMYGLRTHFLNQFDSTKISSDIPQSGLEEVLVPIYLNHRYQIEAAAKSLGGAYFEYSFNNEHSHFQRVSVETQRRALDLLLQSLTPEFLQFPQHLKDLIPPRAYGYGRHRELFKSQVAPAFDPLTAAETCVDLTLDELLQPRRLNRLVLQVETDDGWGLRQVLGGLLYQTVFAKPLAGEAGRLHRLVNVRVVDRLSELLNETELYSEARSEILAHIRVMIDRLNQNNNQGLYQSLPNADENTPEAEAGLIMSYKRHYIYLYKRLTFVLADDGLNSAKRPAPPPGSPIGQDEEH